MSNNTTYENRCIILADLWLNYRDDEEFLDFMQYNDLGLPLAYLIANNIVPSTDIAKGFVNEAFDLLLAGLNIEDVGFEGLDDVLGFGEG